MEHDKQDPSFFKAQLEAMNQQIVEKTEREIERWTKDFLEKHDNRPEQYCTEPDCEVGPSYIDLDNAELQGAIKILIRLYKMSDCGEGVVKNLLNHMLAEKLVRQNPNHRGEDWSVDILEAEYLQ